ncbi:MAG: PDDEXK nuclease domain-containing protein [Firmicutes bacterium]|nr:PDDEXK nuclease domain-containing protein [Bacillota bacterium]
MPDKASKTTQKGLSKAVEKAVDNFGEILSIIEGARVRAYAAVNRELIEMYWEIGKYVSERVQNGTWGKGIVNEIAKVIQKQTPNLSGFSPQNIWRMKQFYEVYKDNEILSPLVREINWTNNVIIMSGKTAEEREFYLRLATANRYSKRELERLRSSRLFERTMISKSTNINALLSEKYDGLTALRDSYVFEFMDMPKDYKEKDLRKAILLNLKDFILEFGKDFSFVGAEVRVQVGNRDFYIDLVFLNRELSCLVAVELKSGEFKPEHIGQMQFYLEALDRDVRKPHENPSVGLILCAEKDDMVVEYALSKSLAPNLVAAYEFMLPDKKLLERKLKEIANLTQGE